MSLPDVLFLCLPIFSLEFIVIFFIIIASVKKTVNLRRFFRFLIFLHPAEKLNVNNVPQFLCLFQLAKNFSVNQFERFLCILLHLLLRFYHDLLILNFLVCNCIIPIFAVVQKFNWNLLPVVKFEVVVFRVIGTLLVHCLFPFASSLWLVTLRSQHNFAVVCFHFSIIKMMLNSGRTTLY